MPNAKLALQHNIGLGGAVVVALYKLGFPGATEGRYTILKHSVLTTVTYQPSQLSFEI